MISACIASARLQGTQALHSEAGVLSMVAAGTVVGTNQAGTDLQTLAAQAGFNNLTAAELQLLTVAPTGAWADCAGSGPPSIASWKRPDRRISAALLQWLCTDSNAAQKVSRQGILIWGAKIEGTLDLSYCQIPFPLTLKKCLTGPLNLYSATIPSVSLTGSHIPVLQADRICIQADLTLNEKFRARGIQLYAAQIGGNLSCWGGRFFSGADRVAINATHVTVQGSIFLDENFRSHGEVRLYHSTVGESISCSGSTLKNPGGNALDATSASIAKDLRLDKHTKLNKTFEAQGCISLSGAQVGGDLNCRGAHLSSPPGDSNFNCGIVLNASAAQVTGTVYLDEDFAADGQVNFNQCKVGKGVSCVKGSFSNPASTALDLESAEITGPVMLKSAKVEGEARFYGAQIHGDLEGVGAQIINPEGKDDGVALNTVRATVRGSCYLSGLHAEGEVRLYGAQIGGDLFAPGSELKGVKGLAVDAQNLHVSGDVNLYQATATGELRLTGAQVAGDLECSGGTFDYLNLLRATIKGTFRAQDTPDKKAKVHKCDWSNAAAGFVDDDESSWPEKGALVLDGFHYGQISGHCRGAKSRLRWLALQTSPLPAGNVAGRESEFLPQPYRHLAKVLSDMGDDDGSKEVLFEMEKRSREQGGTKVWQRVLRGAGNAVLRRTIGYGVYPIRALWWLVALTLLATAVYGMGYINGAVTPSDKDAYATFEKQGQPPPYYASFNAFIYAVENTFPLLHFGQDSAWSPNSGARTQAQRPDLSPTPLSRATARVAEWARGLSSPTFLTWFRWFEICLGWILATLFVAGFSGIVQRG